MKTLAAVLFLAGALNAPAFWNSTKNDASFERMASVFGPEAAFTSQAHSIVRNRAGRVTDTAVLQFAVLQGKVRIDVDMAKTKSGAKSSDDMAVLGGMGLDKMMILVRPDKNATYIVYPGLQGFTIAPAKKMKSAEDKPAKVDQTDLGKETIENHPCIKRKVVTTEANGKTSEMFVWAASDLKDFPIQTEVTDAGDTTTTTFQNIKFDKPAGTQFDIPADYKEYGSVDEMMMSAMQRMMGGQ